jgi:hypothetical protein
MKFIIASQLAGYMRLSVPETIAGMPLPALNRRLSRRYPWIKLQPPWPLPDFLIHRHPPISKSLKE